MDGAISNIIAKAAEANPRVDGDYEKDGLLYCGKCHTQKEYIVELLGKRVKVGCMCRCRTEEFDKWREETIRLNRIEAIKDSAYSEPSNRDCTFENDDGQHPEILAMCKNYVEQFEDFAADGKGLLLYGGVGTGKTYAALQILNALMDRMYTAYFDTFAQIANGLYNCGDKREYINALARYDILCIDDLAAERDSPWMLEQVFSVIDARCKAKKPLIVTTNLTSRQMYDKSDKDRARIYSRLYELCSPIEFVGEDKRIQNFRRDKAKYTQMLRKGL